MTVLWQLAPAEGFFFQDETKLDLNPKVGLAWMRGGQPQPLPTPGTNRKLWISGTLNGLTGKLHGVVGPCKNSELFLKLLNELRCTYLCQRRLHLVLDNDGSQTSGRVQESVQASQGRLHLHPLAGLESRGQTHGTDLVGLA